MLDLLVTRNSDFAAAFAGINDPVVSAGDKVMSPEGEITETFDGSSIPPNFAPIRATDGLGAGLVAGPHREAEQYRFYVPSLPRHDQVQVAFDLIASGQWDPADTVGIRIDSQAAQLLDMAGSSLRAASDGTPLRTKRITLTSDHHSDLLSVALAGSGLQGEQRFSVDNVKVTARTIPAQTFTPGLSPGVSVPLRSPAVSGGAGELESWGAEDRFEFTLSGQDVLLDWQTRSSTVKWTLETDDGQVIGGGLSSDGNVRLRDLDGSHRLSITAAGESPPPSETYSVDVLVTPEAQQFTFELPGPVRLPNDLPSPATANGAGALETKLSEDVYSFTVTGNNKDVTIDPVLCPRESYRERLAWRLVDENNTPVATGTCREQTAEALPAGDYRVRVEPEREVTGTYEIIVTQQGPETIFTTEPAAASNKRTQTVQFASDIDVTGFECALDAPSYSGPFAACSSPKSFTDLADGDHTIRIRAKSPDGSRGPALSHKVTIDTAVPNISITRKPLVVSNINGPVFEYAAEKRGMSYRCSLTPVGSATQFSACNGSSVYRNLTHGSYRFTVLGSDWVGNEATVAYEFMVDLEPPAITLTPASNLTSTSSPQFTFTANEQATYQCSLVPAADTDAFSPCTSPKQYTGLVDGTQYRFW